MRFGAVIAAAGLSSRMGAFKPLLPLGDKTLIERVICSLREGGAEEICVVTGRDAETLERALAGYNLRFVHNRDYAKTDMFYSARLGFASLAGSTEALFFTPADAPLFSAATVRALGERLARGDAQAVIPSHRGRRGHPIALLTGAAEALAASRCADGLREALAPLEPVTLEVDDLGILFDADTPEDYARIKGNIFEAGDNIINLRKNQ